MMANRSDRRLLTLRCVRALEAVGMSTRTRRADFHQGQGSFATPISQAGYMTATRFPLSVPHPCTRAGSIYDTKTQAFFVILSGVCGAKNLIPLPCDAQRQARALQTRRSGRLSTSSIGGQAALRYSDRAGSVLADAAAAAGAATASSRLGGAGTYLVTGRLQLARTHPGDFADDRRIAMRARAELRPVIAKQHAGEHRLVAQIASGDGKAGADGRWIRHGCYCLLL